MNANPEFEAWRNGKPAQQPAEPTFTQRLQRVGLIPDAEKKAVPDIEAYARVLNYRPGERVSFNWQVHPDGKFTSRIIDVHDLPAALENAPAQACCWLGVNPTTATTGRGTEADVSRLTSIYCELDDKNTTEAQQRAIIADLGASFGPPSMIVHSGHGVHLYWPILGGDINDEFTPKDATRLLKRFGRIVTEVAAKHGAGKPDAVWDATRVLRAPGTTNYKNVDEPIPVRLTANEGAQPLTVAEAATRLDAADALYPPPPPRLSVADVVKFPTPYVGESIADKFNVEHTLLDVLAPHGWTCLDADPDADGARWRHPTATSDCSATTRHGCLFVYSPTPLLDVTTSGDVHGYTKFRLHAALNHGGDMSAAAKALRPPADYGHTDYGYGPFVEAEAKGGEADPIAYTDVAMYLAGGLPELPQPSVLQRVDGICIFYLAKRNELYGDPEDGKTMVLLAAAAGELNRGGCVLFVDLDNNGPAETVARLLMLGADRAVLADPNRFRHIEPADADEVLRVVADCAGWATFAGIDCVGELLPLFRASSDSADDYTRVMQIVSGPLERGGAAVILLDHQAKGQESRSYGAGGTMAKRRAVSGVSINLVRKQTFTPGKGGMAELWVNKDRPGGLRAHCQKAEGRRQFAGTFILDPPDPETGAAEWRVTADRAEPPAASIDPVVERHYEAARQLGADGRGATAREIATKANGLPSGTPPTESQKKAAQRAIDKLVQERRLALIEGVSPKRWGITDSGEFVRDTDRDIALFEDSLTNRDKIGTPGTNRRSERGQIRDIGTFDTTADRDDTGSPPTGGPLSLRASNNERSPQSPRCADCGTLLPPGSPDRGVCADCARLGAAS